MVRRKGEITPRRIDRDFPHQVHLEIPECGLGSRLDEMHAFVREAGLDACTRPAGGRERRSAMRWCFGSAEDADHFAGRFGGRRVDGLPNR